ncbi:hypothetical protein THMIRHAS_18080 [Thiosulfatimonas sediminis]|uniref:Uncharacterized protein n=1 Tax=Thiosulfatimonas sediminis TaxID=2675054 RepID=A0A6F8PWD9_9GAMM|nr:hypothetical protein [Thiosulfatimonas sediminis]BBP46435.1 hypothetical protein THMIRHAS_18080 [Thiosulfatimonas sediminis]
MTAKLLLQTGRFTQFFGGINVILLFWYGAYTTLLHDMTKGITLIAISLIIAWSVALIVGGCYLAADSYRQRA